MIKKNKTKKRKQGKKEEEGNKREKEDGENRGFSNEVVAWMLARKNKRQKGRIPE